MSPLQAYLPEIIIAYNPKYAEGKTTSVKTGIWELPDDISSIVLLAVDQPRPAWVIERILNEHTAHGADITSPRFNDHGGHPLIFDSSLRIELASITEQTEGIREIFKKPNITRKDVIFESAIIRLDINTPEAYKEAVASYADLAEQR